MTPDNELRELRDTLAIEITREMVRGFWGSGMALSETEHNALTRVYRMVDAVLSGRNASKPVIPGPDDCCPILHCPACLNGQSFERGEGTHYFGTAEHAYPSSRTEADD